MRRRGRLSGLCMLSKGFPPVICTFLDSLSSILSSIFCPKMMSLTRLGLVTVDLVCMGSLLTIILSAFKDVKLEALVLVVSPPLLRSSEVILSFDVIFDCP
jgi:hypothetical protein